MITWLLTISLLGATLAAYTVSQFGTGSLNERNRILTAVLISGLVVLSSFFIAQHLEYKRLLEFSADRHPIRLGQTYDKGPLGFNTDVENWGLTLEIDIPESTPVRRDFEVRVTAAKWGLRREYFPKGQYMAVLEVPSSLEVRSITDKQIVIKERTRSELDFRWLVSPTKDGQYTITIKPRFFDFTELGFSRWESGRVFFSKATFVEWKGEQKYLHEEDPKTYVGRLVVDHENGLVAVPVTVKLPFGLSQSGYLVWGGIWTLLTSLLSGGIVLWVSRRRSSPA